MGNPFRSKWLDPDLRRSPLRHPYCAICGRALKPDQAHRFVLYELDVYEAVHTEDWDKAEADILGRRSVLGEPVLVEPIGLDCARRLGFDWSREKQDVPLRLL